MKVRVHKRSDEDVAVLVDWTHIEPYWLRSTFAPVDRNRLVDGYSDRWFNRERTPYSFTVGEINLNSVDTGEEAIIFTNGRHRTNLIIKHQALVPISFPSGVPENPDFQISIVKHLEEGDIIDIPDLPIYSIEQMRVIMGQSD